MNVNLGVKVISTFNNELESGSKIILTLEELVGKFGICQWKNLDLADQKRLSKAVNFDTNIPAVVYPKTEAEIAEVMGIAAGNKWGILAYGRGTKLDWGDLIRNPENLKREMIGVSTKNLNRLIEHAVGDLTVTVEAGMKFDDLQRILNKENQFLPIDPVYANESSIGGIVATANTGSLRHRYRGIRDILLGITVIRADGKIAKAGGRVVKNVAGYDLMKLFTGSYGTLGIISQVTLRVYPLPEASTTVILQGATDALTQANQTLLSSALTPTACDLISSQLAVKLGLNQANSLLVRFESIKASVEEQANKLKEIGEKLGLNSHTYQGEDESKLWAKLDKQIWSNTSDTTVVAKIGVIPTAAIATLNKINQTKNPSLALIHAGSGLGILRLDPTTKAEILELRNWCNSQQGFCSILTAPLEIKQQVDIWGYQGNALTLMRQIKTQFDPENILNYHRFVGGI